MIAQNWTQVLGQHKKGKTENVNLCAELSICPTTQNKFDANDLQLLIMLYSTLDLRFAWMYFVSKQTFENEHTLTCIHTNTYMAMHKKTVVS